VSNCSYFHPSSISTLILIYIILCVTVNDGRNAIPNYAGLGNAVTTIFRQEGIKGLYKGVTPNVWGSGSAWGFYFLL